MSRIYLAGPMRGHTEEAAMGWRLQLAADLKDFGHDPMVPGMLESSKDMSLSEFGVSEKLETNETYDKVVAFDFHMVKNCDYLVVNLSYSYKMPVGSLAEISWAHALDIPVIIVGHNEFVDEPFIEGQAICILDSVDEVIPTICALEGDWNGI